jgi:hypothetical protein
MNKFLHMILVTRGSLHYMHKNVRNVISIHKISANQNSINAFKQVYTSEDH